MHDMSKMKIPFVTEYTEYFSTLRKFAGKSLYVLIALSLIVATTDGVGITMLLPLLKVSDLGEGSYGQQRDIFMYAFEWIGIPQTFGWILSVMGVLFLMKGIIKYLEGYLGAVIRAQLFTKWRKQLLRFYSKLDYQYYVSKNTGHFTNVINGQITQASGFVMQYTQFSSRALTALVYLVLAFFLNWQFSLMALLAGLVIIIILKGIAIETKRISILNAKESGTLNKFLIQLLQSFKYLQATARFSYLEKSAIRSIDKIANYQLRVGKLSALLLAVQEPLAIAFMIGIMLYQVNVLGEPLAPLLIILVLFYRTMNTLMMAQSQWQQVMNASGSLQMVVEEFEEIGQHQESNGRTVLPRFNQSIQFQNANFSFKKDKKVIKNISFNIPKNSTVALVGESGSGKTTLTDLMSLLLKPQAGQIFFDGISTSELELHSWRQKIGFVTQDTIIFDDTIANNITLWEGDYNRDENVRNRVEQAATQAYCDRFISELPDGFLTQIGERGIKLSGGQKQRLSIARELYKQPEILILDEATSSLDSESELYIQESIDALKGKMTVIIIAHRLSTIKNADKIIVIDRGEVKEEGSFEELTTIDSRFRQMAELQKI